MKFYPKLFVTHIAVSAVGLMCTFVTAELLAQHFYAEHIETMANALGRMDSTLREQLEDGFRHTLTSAILAALPIAVVVSLSATHLLAKHFVTVVQRLKVGSEAMAHGEYAIRLPAQGDDELSDLARNFNQLSQALGDVESKRIEMITHVAHDLRTPLSSLKGYSEGLLDRLMDPTEVAQRILREVATMERLVSDLSWVSKVEAGAVEIKIERTSVSEKLEVAGERFSWAFNARNITFSVKDTPDLWVLADPHRMDQIINNLLSNALQHTPENCSVTMCATVKGLSAVFSIHDTGSGIPAEHIHRIFDRFYKVDSHRSRQGSGVGLTIARGLVLQMGGQMGASSEPGNTVFWFSLPLADN
ncbi:MAG: HAMP domain-containing sensor histidine kinase [Deinococcaceae bacterium]